MRTYLAAIACVGLAACTVPAPQVGNEPIASDFETRIAALRAQSCLDNMSFARASQLPQTVTPLDLDGLDPAAKDFDGLVLAGAWQLEADDKRFGGLSGLAVMRSGSLLAVSDTGAFAWIGIDPETGAPDGIGAFAEMSDASGRALKGKRNGDAEGLALQDGLALVSFERNHRIEAFDLEGCGAAARAAPVAGLPDELETERINDNRGAEALRLDGETLVAGYEQPIDGALILGEVDGIDGFTITERRSATPLHFLTGTDRDEIRDITAYIYRFYAPGIGNRIEIEVLQGDKRFFARLKAPYPVDNFEGIAIGSSPEGRPRFWIISDDNFNRSAQRTLLFAFDLPT